TCTGHTRSLTLPLIPPPPRPTPFPYTTLFRSPDQGEGNLPRRGSGPAPSLPPRAGGAVGLRSAGGGGGRGRRGSGVQGRSGRIRSEEHTSELQSRSDLVCRLLLEKKKKIDVTR